MRNYIIALLLTLASSALFADSDSRLVVEAKSFGNEEPPSEIQFSITNPCTEPVEIFDSMLPWNSHAGSVFVIRSFSGTLYAANSEIDFGYPSISRTTLAPKQKIEGRLSLKALFPSLRKILSEGNAILLWSCQIEAVNLREPSGTLYGGAIAIRGESQGKPVGPAK